MNCAPTPFSYYEDKERINSDDNCVERYSNLFRLKTTFLVFDHTLKLSQSKPDRIGIRLNTGMLSQSRDGFSIFVL